MSQSSRHTFAEVKAIYKSENGYRAINNYLSRMVHGGVTKYKNASRMNVQTDEWEDGTPLSEIVYLLRKGMVPLPAARRFYRGGSCHGMMSYRLETFLSLSDDVKQAETYKAKDGCLFEVYVEEGIRCTRYITEGETLIEDRCYWEYIGQDQTTGYHRIHLHPPSAEINGYPWKGNAAFPSSTTLSNDRINLTKKIQMLDKNEPINWNAEGGRKRRICTRRRRKKRSPYRKITNTVLRKSG